MGAPPTADSSQPSTWTRRAIDSSPAADAKAQDFRRLILTLCKFSTSYFSGLQNKHSVVVMAGDSGDNSNIVKFFLNSLAQMFTSERYHYERSGGLTIEYLQGMHSFPAGWKFEILRLP